MNEPLSRRSAPLTSGAALPAIGAVLLVALAACGPQPATPAETHDDPAQAPAPASHETHADSCAALEQLAAMDPRQPLPLQPMMAWHQKQNMMEHLVAIERITETLAREDWDGVAEAAALIESSPQMQQMCQHMGAGVDGFTELALDFHRRADEIGVAARAHDTPGVLRATSRTLQACTSCHAMYRQEVVDPATWQARTGSTHDPVHAPAHSQAADSP